MAQQGNKCPGIREYHSFASGYCINSCDHQCVPASVLVHIQHKQRVDKHFGDYVSVTSLLGCLRQLALERSIDYYVEPRMNWYSIRGTLLHSILENPGFEAQIEDMKRFVYGLFRTDEANREDIERRWIEIEARLLDLAPLLPKKSIPNWQAETEYVLPLGVVNGQERFLKGTIDVLRPETGEILDYKTIGDRGLGIILKGAKADHITQFNLYRLLVERGYPVGQSYATYTPPKINKITAYYMTMMDIVNTGGLHSQNSDWLVASGDAARRIEAGVTEDGSVIVGQPEVLGQKEELKCKKGKKKNSLNPEDFELQQYKKFRITYAIPEVPLRNLDEMERFVHSRAPHLFDYFERGVMPPMCDEEMRQWKCESYCADQIREACDAHNRTVGESRIVAPKVKNVIQIGELV